MRQKRDHHFSTAVFLSGTLLLSAVFAGCGASDGNSDSAVSGSEAVHESTASSEARVRSGSDESDTSDLDAETVVTESEEIAELSDSSSELSEEEIAELQEADTEQKRIEEERTSKNDDGELTVSGEADIELYLGESQDRLTDDNGWPSSEEEAEAEIAALERLREELGYSGYVDDGEK